MNELEGINEELLEEVKKSVPYIVAALVIVAGWYGIKSYRASQREAAATALSRAYTTEELEEAVSSYGSSKTGPALKLRLAKKYYDSGAYDSALELYSQLRADCPAAFHAIPAVGYAETLEAQGKFADAKAAYDDFLSVDPESYLALTAKLGSIRCLARTDKAAATKALEELKETVKSDEPGRVRVEGLLEVVKRLK